MYYPCSYPIYSGKIARYWRNPGYNEKNREVTNRFRDQYSHRVDTTEREVTKHLSIIGNTPGQLYQSYLSKYLQYSWEEAYQDAAVSGTSCCSDKRKPRVEITPAKPRSLFFYGNHHLPLKDRNSSHIDRIA